MDKMEELRKRTRLDNWEVKAAFDSALGKVVFDHDPTVEELLLFKFHLITQAAQDKVLKDKDIA